MAFCIFRSHDNQQATTDGEVQRRDANQVWRFPYRSLQGIHKIRRMHEQSRSLWYSAQSFGFRGICQWMLFQHCRNPDPRSCEKSQKVDFKKVRK